MEENLSNVFIVGAPRSGTSALAWALAQHPALSTGPETNILYFVLRKPWLEEQYNATLKTGIGGTWLVENKISYEEFAASLGKGFDQLVRSRSGGRIWVDSSPVYTEIIPQLMVFLPQAKFIHIIRRGQEVVNSLLKSEFPNPNFRNFTFDCNMWNDYVNKGLQAAQVFPGRMLEVRHDALTADPEQEFERIYEFLGLEPSPGSASFIRTKRINSSYLNTTPGDVRNKVKDPSMMPKEPWREWSGANRRLFGKICGETMRRLGYDLDHVLKG